MADGVFVCEAHVTAMATRDGGMRGQVWQLDFQMQMTGEPIHGDVQILVDLLQRRQPVVLTFEPTSPWRELRGLRTEARGLRAQLEEAQRQLTQATCEHDWETFVGEDEFGGDVLIPYTYRVCRHCRKDEE